MIGLNATASVSDGAGHDAPARRPSSTFLVKPKKKGSWLTTLLVAVVMLAGLVGFGVALLGREHAEPKLTESPLKVKGGSIGMEKDSPTWGYVKYAPAELQAPLRPLPVAGRIQVDEAMSARVMAPLPGRVEKVEVMLGQVVVEGQVMLTVRSGALVDLDAASQMAQTEVSAQQRAVERIKTLVQLQALPEKDLLMAEKELREAQLALTSAKLKRQSLRVKPHGDGEFDVVAPRPGVVVERHVSVGQEVGPDHDTPLLVLAELNEVLAVASVPEPEVRGLLPGQIAQVTLAGATEPVFEGVIEHVSPVVDPDRHTVDVRLRMKNMDGALRPNAWVLVAFPARGDKRIVLPSGAVVTDDQTTAVFVKSATGALVRRTVMAGRQRDGKTEIISGLQPGEQVVVQGALLLLNTVQLAQ